MTRTTRVVDLASAGLLAALCIADAQGATAPTARTAEDHSLRLARFYDQRPAWRRCENSSDTPASYQCATISVPVDYAHPEGRTLRLRISCTRTPAKRHGVLLSNPGGPGIPALGLPLQLKDTLPKGALQRYDLIGFDPRGLATSSPLRCGLTRDEVALNSSQPYRAASFAQDTARARAIAAKCTARSGSQLLPYINRRNTARDMDVIRGVLGEKRISYVGWSYEVISAPSTPSSFRGTATASSSTVLLTRTASAGPRPWPWPPGPSLRSRTGAG